MTTWQSDDGLPNNHVTGLTPAPDGYLWVATYSTPARFDGVRFEEFLPKDFGVGSNQKISALAPARNGGLWLGTLHGAVLLLDGDSVTSFKDGLPYKPVQSLLAEADGALWITHQGGTVHRLRDRRLTAFGAAAGLPMPDTPNRYVCSLATDTEGRVWFSKNGHIGVFRDERFVTLLQLTPINARLAPAARGGVWICSEGKLFRFDAGQPLESHGAFTPKPGADPTALLEDRSGGVWIGTSNSGVFHYDGTRIQSVVTPDLRISALTEDRKGNLWVGTVGGGLHRIRPRLVTLETAETGLPTGIVQSLAEDAAGGVWASTQTGLLLRRSGETWRTISRDADWPGGRASALAADPSGAVWIGTRDRALHRWKDGVFTSWRRINGVVAREIHALVVARNGDVWLGLTSPDVVQRLHRGRFETFTMPEGIRVIRAMAEDSAGNIWVGSSKGMLVRIRDGTVTDETSRTTGSPLSIRCLRATADGGLWIGYADEGIGWLKDGRFARVSAAQGFPESNVSQIIPDDAGWLWFAGDHGLFKVRQHALEAFALGRGPPAHVIRFGQSEGLFSLEANFGDSPGAARTRDGRLWIPMRTALAIVDPGRAHGDPEPPPVLLKRVLVDDRTVAAYSSPVPVREGVDLRVIAAPLRLPPGHLRLAFEFATPSFSAPENVRVRYRLEGFDDHWVEAGAQPVAAYSRLPYGSYRFQVQACNSDGVWNRQGATLAFVVTPFIWQTWWFRLAWTVVLVSATIAIVRFVSLRRVRTRLRLLEQQAALHRERTRIARDLHDEFGTRLTELGLLAELERAAAPSKIPPAASPSRSDLIAHIRALERDLDTIVWAVNPQNDTLDHLVGFVCRVTGEFLSRSGIRCRFDLPDEIPPQPLSPELRHNLFLVVREAVNNVVKHASASLVKIALTVEAGILVVRIANDGRGFAVAAAETTGRNGLKNMRNRIEELGGTFELSSSADGGTTVAFRVPLSVSHPPGRDVAGILPSDTFPRIAPAICPPARLPHA